MPLTARYVKLNILSLSYFILLTTHLELSLATATHNFKWVKITHICFMWDQTFVNLDVYTHISFPIGQLEWLFSSSTFFTFCYILLDWLFDFFRRRRNETEKFTVNFCWMTFDLWPSWRKNVDDENSHSNPSKHKAFNQCCFNVGQRRRSWPNIKTVLGECLVFAGIGLI